MTPYWQDARTTILQGDAREVLLLLPGVDCRCGSQWAAITSEWEECCREEGFCKREAVQCRARRCWLCGATWYEVLSRDERGRPTWIYDGEPTWSG